MNSILNEVLTTYLYGTAQKPDTAELATGSYIRDPGASTSMAIDLADYMSTGPGRFAGAHMFDVVRLFFELDFDALGLAPGNYTEQELSDFLRSKGYSVNALVGIDQAQYEDEIDDYMERAFVWNTTAFELKDPDASGNGGARFEISSSGVKSVSGIEIIPFTNLNERENFDYIGGSRKADITNAASAFITDPSSIGRTVYFEFIGTSPVTSMNQVEYDIESYNWPVAMSDVAAAAKIGANASAFFGSLFDDGTIRHLDDQGRPMVYGTNGGDSYGSLVDWFKLESHPLLSAYTGNGITFIAGGGSDNIRGTDSGDAIYGGSGNDELDGEGGADQLYGGTEDDVYIVDDAGDVVTEYVGEGEDLVKSSVEYTLLENVENLELSGSDDINGTGNELDNEIRGNSGNNHSLAGMGGDDTIHGGGGDDTLTGGADNDKLFGDGGADTLLGDDGRDYLAGGENADILLGGSGHDTYSSDAQDTIIDSDGTGQVFLDGQLMTGGKRKEGDPENEYRNGNTLYVLNGTSLLINGGLQIHEFSNGDLGISLETEPDDEEPPEMDEAERRASPIVIDLDGDGVESSGYSRDRYFDHDANGMLESTAWAGADDGLLVRDLDGDGKIHTGRELFGSNTRLASGELADNGFAALSDLDGNQDGIVDSQDSAFAELKIWRDSNQNGLTEAGELLTLSQAGVVAIRTGYDESAFVDANGQAHKQIGTAIRANGTDAAVSDIWFTTDASRRINDVSTSPLAIYELADLPNAKAFGNLMDLHQAMVRDPELKALVEEHVAQGGTGGGPTIDTLIFRWAGVEHIAPDSRGSNVDARELAVVEMLSARPYTNDYTPNDPNPRPEAGNLLTSEFNEFRQYVAAQLEAQTRYADTGIFLGGFASGYSRAMLDLDAFKAYMISAQDTGDTGAILDLVALSTALSAYSPALRTQLDAAYQELIGARPAIEPWVRGLSPLNGTDEADTLFGTGGKEAISGGKGDDVLYGQSGNDMYIYRPGDGNDRIFDSKGADQIYFMGGILPGDISLTRDVSGIIVHVASGGTYGQLRINNVYEGTEGALREGVIEQFRFEDGTTWDLAQILAAVVQQATEGDDGLYGSAVDETLDGLAGNDDIAGYGGNDTLTGGLGDDSLSGGSGNDVLNGGAGNDSLNGGSGNDLYVFELGGGRDVISNVDYNATRLDALTFGAGIDPADVTARRTGNNLVLSISGTDDQVTVTGYFSGGVGAGHGRLDEVRFTDGASSVWDTAAIEAMVLAGTPGDDVIQGYGSADSLAGGAGTDSLYGYDGDDTLNGGAGNDLLSGGAGSDIYVFELGGGQDSINNYDPGVGRVDALVFGPGVDPSAVSARRVGNSLVLSVANTDDRVTVTNYFVGDAAGGHHLDEIRFADAAAVWDVEAVKALVLAPTAGADDLKGYAGDDLLVGEDGNDTLAGHAGADTLRGDAGNDALSGGDGNDVLSGGAGDDTLAGGSGSDTYLFNLGDGNDTINDHDDSVGRLDVLQFGPGIEASAVSARRESNDLVLRISNTGDSVTIRNYFLQDGVNAYRVDEIRFADSESVVWDLATVKALVQAPTAGDDVLKGYESGDTLAGGDGKDTLYGHGGNDALSGQAGDDRVYGGDGDDVLSGGTGADTLEGGAGDDALDGGDGVDVLHGDAGADHLTGGLGDDQLEGGAGNDAYHFSAGDGRDSIRDNEGHNTIYLSGLPLDELYFRREGDALAVYFANSPDDRIRLEDFFDPVTQLAKYGLTMDLGGGQQRWLDPEALDLASLAGTALNDVIRGNTLDNAISGLAGSDTINAGAGDDVLDGGADDDLLFGEAGNDRLVGGSGDDLLDGGTGADQMAGGDGDDMYVVDDAGDAVSELDGSGSDTVRSSVSFALPEDVETLELVGVADVDATGTDAANVLIGNAGNNQLTGMAGDDVLQGGAGNDVLAGGEGSDVLDGGAGADQMIGGSGDDLYYVGESDDVIVEQAGEGLDVVYSTANAYVLSSGLEQIRLVEGSGAMDATGSDDGNVLTGNSNDNVLDGAGGADTLVGGAGDDTYVVDSQADLVVELADEGSDTVRSSVDYVLASTLENLELTGAADLDGTGNDANNRLVGNSGDNRLDGGLGADSMYGGAGNDTFINDSSSDRIYESQGDGVDTVERHYETNLVLSDNVENLILADGIATGNGNELNNVVTGNAGANTLGGWEGDDQLHGLGGDDALFGGTGSDLLLGGNGHDYLDGGEGIDRLEGGSGDDTYVVDESSDVVVEAGSAGNDKVQSTATYTLTDHIETLFLQGAAAIDGTGNAQDNYIAGNAATNVIDGAGGHDTLVGGGGDDTLIGGSGDDKYVVSDGTGADVIDNTGGGFDGVFFTTGITRERLSFSRDGDDLLISVDDATVPAVRVQNHFLGGDAAIDYVQPDGGYYLTTTEINQLVAAGSGGNEYEQVIEGTGAGEQLVGGSGADLIQGLGGADQLFGMGGHDTLEGGEGADYLAGGNGSGSGSGNDRLEGGAGHDTLSGEDGSNVLIGGLGDDSYVYGGGQDTIDTSDGGYDGLFFNGGIDASRLAFSRDGDDLVVTVDADPSTSVRVTGHFLGGESAIDFVQPDGGSLLDTAAINALADGGGGDDPDDGVPGDDSDYSNVVDGTAAGEQLLGSNGRDLLRGLGGDDTLFGFGGDDKFEGGDGADYLSGGNGSFSGSGHDILLGGAGDDTLVGEDGDDYLVGGSGNDAYYYAAGSGRDTIDNRGGGSDYIYFASIARERLSFHRDGDDLLVRVDGDDAEQVRVLDHFLGGEHAIAFVQPGDGGYGIPASQFEGLLAPMAASSAPAMMMATGGDLPASVTGGTTSMATGGHTPASVVTDGSTRAMATGGNQPASVAGPTGELDYLYDLLRGGTPVDALRDTTNWWRDRHVEGLFAAPDGATPTAPITLDDAGPDAPTPVTLVEPPTLNLPDREMTAPTLPASRAGAAPGQASPELDLLINAMCGYPPAVTTHEGGDWGEGLMGRYGAWAASHRPHLRGREVYATVEP